MPSNKCKIDNDALTGGYGINEKHLTVPGGSFINFRNTSYEATKVFFSNQVAIL